MIVHEVTQERWRPFCDGLYEASSSGRVRRAKPDRFGRTTGWPLRTQLHRGRTPVVSISIDGVRKLRGVHQCVAEAFHGPCESGLEINHKDGNPRNNTPDNLEYITHAENCAHAARLGLVRTRPRPGEENPNVKLTEGDVFQIRRRRAEGVTLRALAEEYGVSTSLIDVIGRRVAWRHLP